MSLENVKHVIHLNRLKLFFKFLIWVQRWLTSTGVYMEERKLIRTVLNLKLIEQYTEDLRCRHGAVDADVGDRTKRWGENCSLTKQEDEMKNRRKTEEKIQSYVFQGGVSGKVIWTVVSLQISNINLNNSFRNYFLNI